jgi:hypothetical protein
VQHQFRLNPQDGVCQPDLNTGLILLPKVYYTSHNYVTKGILEISVVENRDIAGEAVLMPGSYHE